MQSKKFTYNTLKTSPIKGLIAVLMVSFMMLSCNKRRQNDQMPYVPVDLNINLTLPGYSNLNFVGGWVYVSGGNDGIILYRQSYTTMMAYERRCTLEPFDPCGFGTLDSTETVVVCDCDGSEYHIFDGSVIKGPAVTPLFQYRTNFNPDNSSFRVYN